MLEKIKENLLQIREEIEPYTPNIIAVTKYFGKEAILECCEAGLRDFGENRVIEASSKINELPESIRKDSKFHLIGHLQTNKAAKAVETFDLIHSVDSLKLAQAISKEALKAKKRQKILLQLNNAGEVQKGGFSIKELFENFAQISNLEGTEVVGLMSMAPLKADTKELTRLFKQVRDTRDKLERNFGCNLQELSMGMSRDYKEAAYNGATMLRIGRKLLGT